MFDVVSLTRDVGECPLQSNTIVLRNSPDWKAFNIEDTRAFCTKLGFPSSMIIDFARLWDMSMRFDYREYRQQIKNISLNNAVSCGGASIINYQNYLAQNRNSDDWYYFTDDDDWIAPDAFNSIVSVPSKTAVWGSVYIGRLYTDSEMAKTIDQVINFREINSSVFYTNNYSLKGSVLDMFGNGKLVEHYDAQFTYDSGLLEPFQINSYLSAANKHPCCTMAILYNMKSDDYRKDIHGALEQFTDELDEACANLGETWLTKNVRCLIKLNRDTIN